MDRAGFEGPDIVAAVEDLNPQDLYYIYIGFLPKRSTDVLSTSCPLENSFFVHLPKIHYSVPLHSMYFSPCTPLPRCLSS